MSRSKQNIYERKSSEGSPSGSAATLAFESFGFLEAVDLTKLWRVLVVAARSAATCIKTSTRLTAKRPFLGVFVGYKLACKQVS